MSVPVSRYMCFYRAHETSTKQITWSLLGWRVPTAYSYNANESLLCHAGSCIAWTIRTSFTYCEHDNKVAPLITAKCPSHVSRWLWARWQFCFLTAGYSRHRLSSAPVEVAWGCKQCISASALNTSATLRAGTGKEEQTTGSCRSGIAGVGSMQVYEQRWNATNGGVMFGGELVLAWYSAPVPWAVNSLSLSQR